MGTPTAVPSPIVSPRDAAWSESNENPVRVEVLPTSPVQSSRTSAPVENTPTPTPPPKDPGEVSANVGLLFLGGLSTILLGWMYALFRLLRRKKRKGTRRRGGA